jgi:hypothetical protein
MHPIKNLVRLISNSYYFLCYVRFSPNVHMHNSEALQILTLSNSSAQYEVPSLMTSAVSSSFGRSLQPDPYDKVRVVEQSALASYATLAHKEQIETLGKSGR